MKVLYSEGLATHVGREPCAGVEGWIPDADGAPLGARGVGALVIGAVKYRIELALFE
jgi:hypothetical protein